MDIYDLKMMGHSGFEFCRIVDSPHYEGRSSEVDGVLFVGDVDDAPECLDNLEITSIDIFYAEKLKRVLVTIDVSEVDAETLDELHQWRDEQDTDDEFEGYPAGRDEPPSATDDESDGRPADGSEPQLAASDF